MGNLFSVRSQKQVILCLLNTFNLDASMILVRLVVYNSTLF